MFDSAGTIQFDTKLHWDWRRASDLNSCKDRVTDNSSPTSKGHTQPTYEMTPGFNLLQTSSDQFSFWPNIHNLLVSDASDSTAVGIW